MSGEREGLADLGAMRAAHRDSYPMGNTHHGTPERPDWGTFCVECKESWPCEVTLLLDHIDALADLLAARDRRVRAGALRDAADNWPREGNAENLSREMATNLREIPPEYRVDQWLRDRADRIEADR